MTKLTRRVEITCEIIARARPRNAANTRAALLEAAQTLFARDGYDDVGMRDIARQVGVDAAMVSRYFGSKEDLFVEALGTCGEDSRSLMDGDRDDFGRRMAHELIYEPQECDRLRGLLIMLRANGSAKAVEMVQRTVVEEFVRPFEMWLGGERALVRARLATSIIMGFGVSRSLLGDAAFDDADKAVMFERLADLLQRCVDE